jgi:hypothetical protein
MEREDQRLRFALRQPFAQRQRLGICRGESGVGKNWLRGVRGNRLGGGELDARGIVGQFRRATAERRREQNADGRRRRPAMQT